MILYLFFKANFVSAGTPEGLELQPMPCSVAEMLDEAKRTGCFHLKESDKITPRQKLLKVMWSSEKAGRSPFHTTW